MSSLKPNEPFFTRYHLVRRIGVGGYSEVWLANDTLAGNMQVALKIFAPDKGLDEQGIALFSKEYALVFNLNHPNLLKPSHFDVAEGSPYLVLTYCPAGSVFSKIGSMTEAELAKFMYQAASALSYLHSQEPPIIHQDIKPDNFLIDNQGNYLLSDFGISSKIRRTLTRSMGAQGSTGTMAYMPPEKWSRERQVIKASDVFSLGVALFELVAGDLPFGDHGGLALNSGAEIPDLPSDYSLELNNLLRNCLSKEPWERPTAEVLQQVAQNYLSSGSWQADNNSISEAPLPGPPIKPSQRPMQPIDIKLESTLEKAIDAGEFTVFFKQAGTLHDETRKSYFYIELIKKWGQIGFDEFEQAFLLQLAEYKNKRPATLYISEAEMEFIWVEGGTFIMGSENGKEDEKPVHQVTLDGFYLGKTPVTQKQWQRIMESNPSYFKGEDLPVESVSWDDTQKYFERLNQLTRRFFRLPTEAEWEYAAGGGKQDRTKWAGTNDESNLSNFAWSNRNSQNKTHKVAIQSPNILGLFDMSGNVWEWCSDWYGNYIFANQTNPEGPSTDSGRVLRGGSWRSYPAYLRVAYRSYSTPFYRNFCLGFRVVLAP